MSPRLIKKDIVMFQAIVCSPGELQCLQSKILKIQHPADGIDCNCYNSGSRRCAWSTEHVKGNKGCAYFVFSAKSTVLGNLPTNLCLSSCLTYQGSTFLVLLLWKVKTTPKPVHLNLFIASKREEGNRRKGLKSSCRIKKYWFLHSCCLIG